MAHPHVERAAEAKREAAIGLVELHRGHPDIHHDAVDRQNALRCANLGQIGKAVLDQRQPAVRLIHQIEPGRDRCAVAVDADHPCAGEIENGPAVAAGPEGGVDIDAAIAGLEHFDGFAAQHGNMTRGVRIHAQAQEQTPEQAPEGVRPVEVILDANGPIAPQMSTLCRAFPVEKPPIERTGRGAMADPPRAQSQTLISRRNLVGCHGISSVNGASAAPKPVRLFTT